MDIRYINLIFTHCSTNPLQPKQVKNWKAMNAKTQLSLFGQVSELKISYNPKTRPSDRPSVSSSRQAWDIFFKEWEEPAYFESFKVMTLNRANKVLGVALISRGGLAGTVADPKIILQYALLSNASSIILAHNHPSGNMTPSEADIKLTRKIKEACIALDIACLDHVILCSEEKVLQLCRRGYYVTYIDICIYKEGETPLFYSKNAKAFNFPRLPKKEKHLP